MSRVSKSCIAPRKSICRPHSLHKLCNLMRVLWPVGMYCTKTCRSQVPVGARRPDIVLWTQTTCHWDIRCSLSVRRRVLAREGKCGRSRLRRR